MDHSYTDRELLQQVAAGDKTAFRTLFDLYRIRLFSFVLKLTSSRVDAEEIVQDVFAKLWESRSSLTEVEYPGKYIYTIARNKTLNHLTKVARDRQLMQQLWVNLSQSDNPVEEILLAQESQRLIGEAVSRLSARHQTIFRLSRDQGLSHEEIATRLGLSKSRVKNMLVEILKHIRDHLARYSALVSAIFWMSYSLKLL